MNKVFECPNCQQPFQVQGTQAGQVVQCPGCTHPVEIPADAFQAPPAPKPQIHSCPNCRGQFGITSDMLGNQVGCPHCQASILIEEPAAQPKPNDDVATTSESDKRKPRFKTRLKKPTETKQPDASKTPLASGAKSQKKLGSSQKAESKPVPRSSKHKQSTTAQSASLKTSAPKTSAAKPEPTKQKSTAASKPIENKRPAAEAPQSSASSKPPSGPNAAASTEFKPKVATEPIDPRPSIAHLLPPLFEALDPTRLGNQSGADAFKVMLPDGEGGTKQVDQRVVRVEHGGMRVSLVAMTQAEKRRRKLIQNIIAIVIGIIVLAVAFTLLQ